MAAKWSMTKWSKYRIMKKSRTLLPHLPETLPMKRDSLRRLLAKHGEVIIKPSGSYGGNGVILIKQLKDKQYELHDGSKIIVLDSNEQLQSRLKRRVKRSYIVQKRIKLATVRSCPFDIRVMVQRRKSGGWHVTGILAKVAGKGFIITNVRRSNGYVLPIEKAIRRSVLKEDSTEKLLADVRETALATVKTLAPYYPKIRSIGVDMGFDRNGHVWIIEANFAPSRGLFRKLKDKSMYRKILGYG